MAIYNPKYARAVVLLSGGLDSSTVLAVAYERFRDVTALSINYGQRHIRELSSAVEVANWYNVKHEIVDLSQVGMILKASSKSSLLGGSAVPDGHYAEENMKQTIVPNRNMMMISIAAAVVVAQGGGVVGVATHAGDHFIYPDCRPGFLQAMTLALKEGNDDDVSLWAPFMKDPKEEIVRVGSQLSVPYHLTWSCYKGGEVHCGQCGTCVERIEAFQKAGVEDPTVYDAEGLAAAHAILANKAGHHG